MKNLLLIIFLLVILVSCNKNEVPNIIEPLPSILEYQPSTMFYPALHFQGSNKIRLLYTDDNKISLRIGNIIATTSGHKIYEYIGDTVKYYQDSIVITKQLLSNEDFSEMPEFKRKLITHNGYIVKEIYYLDYYRNNNDDTLLYSYNNKNQIDEIIQIQSYYNKTKFKLKFDDNGNLNMITSVKYFSGNPINMDTMWFSNYDSSPNLTKNLIIFSECFYRSLSTNNFRKYLHKSYRVSDSSLISTQWREWEFSYDKNNYPIY